MGKIYFGSQLIYDGESSVEGTPTPVTLSGDATSNEVLDGKFFYSDDSNTKEEGTMPNNAGDVNAVSCHASGSDLHVIPAAGFTDGSDDAAVISGVQVDSSLVSLLHFEGNNNSTTFTDVMGITWTRVALR